MEARTVAKCRLSARDRVRRIFRGFIARCHEKRRCLIEWRLEEDVALRMVQQPCYYCGRVPGPGTWGGIDRFDSRGSYTEENTAPCCTTCNIMKNVLTPDVFVEQCKRVVSHATHVQTSTTMCVTINLK